MAKPTRVPRPTKKAEFDLEFATRNAIAGWRDLCATQRNAMADTWDFLTRTPTLQTPTNYPLKGGLGAITRDGRTFQRWQHKPTAGGTARIWFYVDRRVVRIEQIHTHHPNATK